MEYREELKTHLLKHQTEPVVLRGLIPDWPARSWTPDNLEDQFGSEPLTFRIGRHDVKQVQWEAQCEHVSATIAHFNQWLCGDRSPTNPLHAFSCVTHWCYADYKHMKDLPARNRHRFLSAVDWSNLGFTGRDGTESTFWLGSEGAHTLCHYDTYGCNLVAQIYGRKRWTLFPPSQSSCLYPTRIPYEESSVFSCVNVVLPDYHAHPAFKRVTPHIVTLQPGDVLFVPHGWWHHVDSIDVSLSINTWIDSAETDDAARLSEALTRMLVFALMSQDTPTAPPDTWLNPTEDLSDHAEHLQHIQASLTAVLVRRAGMKRKIDVEKEDEATGLESKSKRVCTAERTVTAECSIATVAQSSAGAVAQSSEGVVAQSSAGVIVQSSEGAVTWSSSATVAQSCAGVVAESSGRAVAQSSGRAVAQISEVVAQSSDVVAQSRGVVAQSSDVVAQSSEFIAQSSGVVAQSSVGVVARSNDGAVAHSSAATVAQSSSGDAAESSAGGAPEGCVLSAAAECSAADAFGECSRPTTKNKHKIVKSCKTNISVSNLACSSASAAAADLKPRSSHRVHFSSKVEKSIIVSEEFETRHVRRVFVYPPAMRSQSATTPDGSTSQDGNNLLSDLAVAPTRFSSADLANIVSQPDVVALIAQKLVEISGRECIQK